MSFTASNHYVPIWYQKRFLNGKSRYYYLDLNPDKITQNGFTHRRTQVRELGPKLCFVQDNLYTLKFNEMQTDLIEKYLYGPIDDNANKYLNIFLNEEWENGHTDSFQHLMEFMCSQYMRTPKGLDLIKQELTNLLHRIPEYNMVLNFMGNMRRYFVTVWTECIWEIVSAEESEIKFIVTDHPIALYHPFCYPHISSECVYPYDPHPWKVGTQVIYPLTLEKCLILTHIENFRNKVSTELMRNRTNSRAFKPVLMVLSDIIRDRRLSSDQVTQINYVLKARAAKFIAAPIKEWLFPELTGYWQDIRNILLPAKSILGGLGNTYIGYENGQSEGYDEFGRSIQNAQNEFVKIKEQTRRLMESHFKKKQEEKKQ